MSMIYINIVESLQTYITFGERITKYDGMTVYRGKGGSQNIMIDDKGGGGGLGRAKKV